MTDFPDTVLANVKQTTRSAGPALPGTIIARKKGDFLWWIAAATLLGGLLAFVYVPDFRNWMINVIAHAI